MRRAITILILVQIIIDVFALDINNNNQQDNRTNNASRCIIPFFAIKKVKHEQIGQSAKAYYLHNNIRFKLNCKKIAQRYRRIKLCIPKEQQSYNRHSNTNQKSEPHRIVVVLFLSTFVSFHCLVSLYFGGKVTKFFD